MYEKEEIQKHYLAVWDSYSTVMKEALICAQGCDYDVWSEPYTEFLKSGIIIGDIPREMPNRATDALRKCLFEPFDPDNVHPQFFSSLFSPGDKLENLKKNTSQFRLSAEALWMISDINDHFRDQLASCLGSPWRTLGTRAWYLTDESLDNSNANNWHNDALPLCIYKVMYYLTPLNSTNGSLRVRTTDGQEILLEREGPTWVLFKPSELMHRGVPPTLQGTKRFTVESPITPSVTFGTTAFFAGQNAHHPHYPWQRACYDGY